MLLNFGKCKCLHTGRGNLDAYHTILLGTKTVKEKDLGLIISADMKVSEQCGIAALQVSFRILSTSLEAMSKAGYCHGLAGFLFTSLAQV